MKQCLKCNELKPPSDFYKNKLTKDGLSSSCKVCHNAYTQEWGKKHKKQRYSYRVKSYNKKRSLVTKYKEDSKCKQCGENHPACLQFHHRDSKEKEFAIGCSVVNKGMQQLMDEIAKCDVLCANCHMKLHYALKETEK